MWWKRTYVWLTLVTIPARIIAYTWIVTQITAYFGDKIFQLFGVFIDSSAAPWFLEKYLYFYIILSNTQTVLSNMTVDFDRTAHCQYVWQKFNEVWQKLSSVWQKITVCQNFAELYISVKHRAISNKLSYQSCTLFQFGLPTLVLDLSPVTRSLLFFW